MANKALLGVVGLIAVAGGGAYTLLYTNVPLKMVETKLKTAGFEVTDLDGNLSTGLTISALILKEGQDQLLIADIKIATKGMNGLFAYAALAGHPINKKIAFEEVSIGGFTMETTGDASSKIAAKKSLIANFDPKSAGIEELKVGLFKLNNIAVKNSSFKKPVMFKEFKIADIMIGKEVAKIQEIALSSRYADLKMRGLRYEGGRMFMDEKIAGTIKAQPMPEILRKDVSFWLSAEFKDKKYSGEFAFFDEKIKIAIKPDESISSSIKGLTLKEYLAMDIPLTDINLEFNASNMITAMLAQPTGTFKLGENVFETAKTDPNAAIAALGAVPGAAPGATAAATPPTSQPAPAATSATPGTIVGKFTRDNIQFSLTLGASGAPAVPGTYPYMLLTSTISPSSQENLSVLYFKAPYGKLDATQKASVDRDMTYFNPGQNVPLASIPGQAPVGRTPANKPAPARRR